MDIKENLAENLISYRKAANLTQAELAEKLNYSDKAVSKWERGESFPDLYVLKQIADFYGVTIDTLINEPKKPEKAEREIRKKGKRVAIVLCSIGIVWLVAVCCFAFINMIIPTIENTWLSFIFAIPITCIILTVFSCIWKHKALTYISVSLLVWSIILSIFLLLYLVLPNPPATLWMIFLIAIPLQALIFFWQYYKRNKL